MAMVKAALNDSMPDYSVKIGRREMVAAALPLQEHWLPQSNLDLLLPPVNVSTFFCYRPISNLKSFSVIVANLKTSLSQTLVSFYPFAGRLMINGNGEPEILCNNEGVEFSEAYADVEIAEVDFSEPDLSVEGKLVPARHCSIAKDNESLSSLLCVQVTKFKCGAMVVGCTFDHRVADAYSTNMFFLSWAEISRTQLPILTPTFRRSHLHPRRPFTYPPLMDNLYITMSSLKLEAQPKANNLLPPLSVGSRIYYLDVHKIENLQALACGTKGKRRSKLEAFCAYLWRLIANASQLEDKANCKMGVVVDGRSRLRKVGLPANYFGNVLSIPFAEAKAGDLAGKPCSWAADLIHECIAGASNEQHFQDLINWVEVHRPEPALAKIYSSVGGGDGPSVVVSSGLRFPVCDLDFGLGKTAFASYHFPWGSEAGYVMPLPSPAGDGSWVVYMHLSQCLLDAIQAHPDFILLPLTPKLLASIIC